MNEKHDTEVYTGSWQYYFESDEGSASLWLPAYRKRNKDIKYWPDEKPSDGPRGLTYGCLFSTIVWGCILLFSWAMWLIFAQ